jgi:AAA15 family ATPase/GTPase
MMPKRIRIVSLRLVNFKSYADYVIDFTNGKKSIQRMTGLYGRNGVGKSTLLDAVGMLFKRYAGYDRERLASSFQRYVRNTKMLDVVGTLSSSESLSDDEIGKIDTFKLANTDAFRIEAKFVVEDGRQYDVVIGNSPDLYEWDRNGFMSGVKAWHPEDIAATLEKQCYVTTYDKELNKFQLIKSRWPVFAELFTAVSGFPVSMNETVASEDTDEKYRALYNQYALGLKIQKPGETITDRQCSDGEKKIIKNFTTLLNMEFTPSVILIDNVEMHVEIDRHMPLIRSIEKCFPDSQIIFTTHSEKIVSEAPLEMLVSLTNKQVSRSDVWRRRMFRVVKAMKLLYKDDESVATLAGIERDLDDHRFSDVPGVITRIMSAGRTGNEKLIAEIKMWAEN